jgi:hypothetical protein
MKRSIFIGAFALFLGAVALTGCSNENSTEASATAEEVKTTTYYCPMKCEGDKVYDEAGSCPVCGMDLVKKK